MSAPGTGARGRRRGTPGASGLAASVFGPLALGPSLAVAAVLEVPADHPSIQAAIDFAADGDTVRIAPGEYRENLVLEDKSVSLVSHLTDGGDATLVERTVIDGGGERAVLRIKDSVRGEPLVRGITLRNAKDGVSAAARFVMEHCRVSGTSDGIDFEDGSGGVVRRSVFEGNSDDGIDLDRRVDVLIEHNIIRDNGDDGIEIRLHDYDSGEPLDIVIRHNRILGNGEDGIQLIDGQYRTPRRVLIARNLILDNRDVGVGMMPDMISKENFEGADLDERVLVINNTFAGNGHGLTGGDATTVVNNIFVGHAGVALKRLREDSAARFNLFHGNGVDATDATLDRASSLFVDPRLDERLVPRTGSPAIDAGTARVGLDGWRPADSGADVQNGDAPDLGFVETGSAAARASAAISPALRPGAASEPSPRAADGGASVLSVAIRSGADDGEERDSGRVDLDSGDLEMVFDKGEQIVAMRFADVDLPPGASIESAHVQFRVEQVAAEPTSLLIEAEAVDDAAPIRERRGDISSRERTRARATWQPVPWLDPGAATAAQRSPDLAALLQEIVDRPGWESGNAVLILVSGSGERVAESYEGSPDGAPTLVVRWRGGGS